MQKGACNRFGWESAKIWGKSTKVILILSLLSFHDPKNRIFVAMKMCKYGKTFEFAPLCFAVLEKKQPLNDEYMELVKNNRVIFVVRAYLLFF